jgi:DNA-directed RNA polymerase subunit N (RpoN/RPB10)
MEMTETLDEAAVLSYEPFYGDETDATPLKDKMVTARKSAECHTCGETIQPGWRIRSLTERNNEEKTLVTFRFCFECCKAMAISAEDGEDAIEARMAMRK